MKILIDIGHPAHVHLFKNFAWEMESKGNIIFFTCREKEYETYLLGKYNFQFKSFGRKYSSKVGKLWGLIEFDVKEYIEAIKFKPDLLLSHGSMYAAHASLFLNKPHISFEDTFNKEQLRFYLPATKTVLTGNYDHPSIGDREIRYNGYHELAYLHPNYFNNKKEKISKNKFVIIRLVAWNATHDYGHTGIFKENIIRAINVFKNHGEVFISSEYPLPSELQDYRLNIPPENMHHFMAAASLLFSESATMAAESAILGVPSIYLDNTGRYYTKELEKKYNLCFNYTESEKDQKNAIEKAVELLTTLNIKEEWQKRREKMLADQIDVTAFFVWFAEKYPESAKVMRENPDFQYNFR